tara:strand:+ start:616 stop:1266 length:651 start_codon:yes stop_codon:yes gene_type:complete
MKIIIPARGGSKRVLNKNIIMLNHRPLISYSIEEALKITNEVYVSTDSDSIADISSECGAKIIKRPAHLATDFSNTNSVIEHFLNSVEEVEYFACVQPTSPLLTAFYLKKGFDEARKTCYDSIISVVENTSFFWNASGTPMNFDINKKPRTQEMEKWYSENGAFYITSKNSFLETKNIVNGKVGFIEMPKKMSFEIDTYEDLEIIEKLLMKNNIHA